MKPTRSLLLSCLALGALHLPGAVAAAESPIAIAIHGGAGTITPEAMSPDREQAYRSKLEEAVRAGHELLAGGATSLEAVRAAINIMEDSPLFNAGKGAVFNSEGQNELDASVMDGATLNAGAVAAVHRIRNPIDLAMEVMTHSKHVMMIGEGAEMFAAEQGFEFVDPAYFHTDRRWQELQERKAAETAGLPTGERYFSTVGAVALDRQGNLAAGTSTGGMTNKRYGRVGDSPIIGAGTYANNASCAVSATGHGEYFIRYVVASDICNRVAAGSTVQQAGDKVIKEILVAAGAQGGVIIMDSGGSIAMPHNTPGMYRAKIDSQGELYIGIYGDAP